MKRSLDSMLVRRELWEHRSLWIAPLAGAAFWICACVVLVLRMDAMPTRGGFGVVAGSVPVVAGLLLLICGIVVATYLIDCLYSERKDRSILFWKSLPVSDTRTVLAKLAVGLVLVPLAVAALAIATHFVSTLIAAMRFEGVRTAMASELGAWAQQCGLLFVRVILLSLWYAPIAAYLLLVSAIAKRSPFVIAIIPPLVLTLVERFVFETTHVGRLLASRFVPSWGTRGSWSLRADLWDSLIVPALSAPGLWLGIIAAAAMTWGAIRLRRYRDDT